MLQSIHFNFIHQLHLFAEFTLWKPFTSIPYVVRFWDINQKTPLEFSIGHSHIGQFDQFFSVGHFTSLINYINHCFTTTNFNLLRFFLSQFLCLTYLYTKIRNLKKHKNSARKVYSLIL